MKIICDAPGQTCNRLWSYVALLSECIVKGEKLVILFFDYTIDDFPNFRNSSYIYFPFYHRRILRIGRNWNRFKHLTWKITHNAIFDKIFRSLGFVKGWYTRQNVEYIFMAKKELIRIFTPDQSLVLQAQELFNNIHEQAQVIVGVHIRRGDYATWNNGRFYYEHSDYYNFMCKVKELYHNQTVAFFISSNEPIDLSEFHECSCFHHSIGSSAVLDLYSLSLCDKIIGPFSTFSRWASFIGEKPLCFLQDREQDLSENSFSIITDYFHFENGIEIEDW